MKIFKGIIPVTSIITILIILTILLLNLTGKIDINTLKALIIAAIVTFLNFIGGLAGIKYSSDKTFNQFMMILFGGMMVRLLFLLLIVFISLRFLDIKTDVFIFGIFIFYFFYLFVEIFTLFKEKKVY